MAERISTGLISSYSTAQGRKFGLTVGTAFLVLGALVYWRGRHTATTVLVAMGGLLVLAAVCLPSRLGPIERVWMRMAVAISKVTAPVFMGVVYFVVITPTGLLRRLMGKNTLARERKSSSYWVTRDADDRRGDLQRQF